MLSVADVLAGGIKTAGATRMFGVPGGGSSLELMEAARRCRLPFVLCHQETAACIMAAVSGELTGTPGAALVALGPGVASAVNGLAYALLDRAPLVVFTDRHPENVRAFTTHQALDQPSLLASVTKASWIVDAAAAPAQIAEAVELALAEPPGPVHLELSGRRRLRAGERVGSDGDSRKPTCRAAGREPGGGADSLLAATGAAGRTTVS